MGKQVRLRSLRDRTAHVAIIVREVTQSRLLRLAALFLLGAVFLWPFLRFGVALVEEGELREVSTERVRVLFEKMTGRDLPLTIDNVRSLWQGGPDTEMYLRFDTDSDGVTHLLHMLGGELAQVSHVDELPVDELARLCPDVSEGMSAWKQHFGVSMFDNDVVSGQLLVRQGCRGYTLLVDDTQKEVHLFLRDCR